MPLGLCTSTDVVNSPGSAPCPPMDLKVYAEVAKEQSWRRSICVQCDGGPRVPVAQKKTSALSPQDNPEYTHALDLVVKSDSSKLHSLFIFDFFRVVGFSALPQRTPSWSSAGENCSGSGNPGTTRKIPVRRERNSRHSAHEIRGETNTPAILRRNSSRTRPSMPQPNPNTKRSDCAPSTLGHRPAAFRILVHRTLRARATGSVFIRPPTPRP